MNGYYDVDIGAVKKWSQAYPSKNHFTGFKDAYEHLSGSAVQTHQSQPSRGPQPQGKLQHEIAGVVPWFLFPDSNGRMTLAYILPSNCETGQKLLLRPPISSRTVQPIKVTVPPFVPPRSLVRVFSLMEDQYQIPYHQELVRVYLLFLESKFPNCVAFDQAHSQFPPANDISLQKDFVPPQGHQVDRNSDVRYHPLAETVLWIGLLIALTLLSFVIYCSYQDIKRSRKVVGSVLEFLELSTPWDTVGIVCAIFLPFVIAIMIAALTHPWWRKNGTNSWIHVMKSWHWPVVFLSFLVFLVASLYTSLEKGTPFIQTTATIGAFLLACACELVGLLMVMSLEIASHLEWVPY